MKESEGRLREHGLHAWEGRKHIPDSGSDERLSFLSTRLPVKCSMWNEIMSTWNNPWQHYIALVKNLHPQSNQILYSEQALQWTITVDGLPQLPSIFSAKSIQILLLELSTSL